MSDTLFIGNNFIELDHIPSTNTYALSLIDGQPPEGTAISAHQQTKGRGQTGNSWEAEAGKNLTLSIILYPSFLKGQELFYLSKMSSVAVRNCIGSLLPQQEVLIKWPNDILLNRKKVAGILIENQLEAKTIKASILGMGINVNQQSFSPELIDTACAIRQYCDRDVELQEVSQRLFGCLESEYLKLRAGRKAELDQTYFKHLYGYQEEVVVEIEGSIHQLMMVGVDVSGRLALEMQGQLRYFDIKELKFILDGRIS